MCVFIKENFYKMHVSQGLSVSGGAPCEEQYHWDRHAGVRQGTRQRLAGLGGTLTEAPNVCGDLAGCLSHVLSLTSGPSAAHYIPVIILMASRAEFGGKGGPGRHAAARRSRLGAVGELGPATAGSQVQGPRGELLLLSMLPLGWPLNPHYFTKHLRQLWQELRAVAGERGRKHVFAHVCSETRDVMSACGCNGTCRFPVLAQSPGKRGSAAGKYPEWFPDCAKRACVPLLVLRNGRGQPGACRQLLKQDIKDITKETSANISTSPLQTCTTLIGPFAPNGPVGWARGGPRYRALLHRPSPSAMLLPSLPLFSPSFFAGRRGGQMAIDFSSADIHPPLVKGMPPLPSPLCKGSELYQWPLGEDEYVIMFKVKRGYKVIKTWKERERKGEGEIERTE
ncbi:hypothetical protein P4O66_004398 [Electrophorus voltai]|uniref:Uncharacterized protein n=1 Tax=Electrophorus voltai TaxID=2609070 RepID=A0AAD8ZR70_9TELE|nr:hypothetical protein P4O66_004398 [Electrophorus voltai]